MNSRHDLENDLRQMKQTYSNVVDANVKLSDEKTLLERDNKLLQRKVNRAIEYLREHKKYSKKELLDILQAY